MPATDLSDQGLRARGRRAAGERVFGAGDRVVFALLTLANLASAGGLLAWWFSRGDLTRHPVEFAILTVPLLVALAMYEARWLALPAMRRPRHVPARSGLRVGVATTFVGGSEPLAMLEQTVRALVAMEYPHDTWVLDEDDDPRVIALCERLGARHFSRRRRPGLRTPAGEFAIATKHGNVNSWLAAHAYDAYDLVVAFDPDHVPRPEFLDRVLGHFRDPRVGYVQAAQVYYNQPASFIARGAAEETYPYYSSIQMSAYAMGYPIVTGCHNAHRVSALREVGGFAAHDADDLLITMLYRAAGWRGVYVPEALAFGLTPVDWPSYLTQQRRWTRSVLDVKLRVFPALAGRLPLRERAVSLVHGLYPVQVLGGALGVGVLAFMLASGSTPGALAPRGLVPAGLAVAATLLCDLFRQRFFLDRRRESGLHWRARLLRVAKWPWVVLALGDALLRRRRPYAVTRKVPAGRPSRAVALPHLAVVALLAGAAAVGIARHAVHNPVVGAAALLVALVSGGIAASAGIAFPHPFDPALARRRLADATGDPLPGTGSHEPAGAPGRSGGALALPAGERAR